MSEDILEVPTAEPKRKRSPKNTSGVKKKPGRPKKVVEAKPEVEESIQAKAPTEVMFNGWPVADGFSRIMLFPQPHEGSSVLPEIFQVGERPKVMLYKNVMHVVPNAIAEAIINTANEYPEDDRSNPAKIVRHGWPGSTPGVIRSMMPHSDPTPATLQDYKDYINLMKTRPLASDYIAGRN